MLLRLALVLPTSISAANLIALEETESLVDLDLAWCGALVIAFALIWISVDWAKTAGR